MSLSPTSLDLCIANYLAGFLKFHPFLNQAVQSMIRHDVLGGIWFGAALFICWIEAIRQGRSEIQLRVLTILIASTLAILLTLLAEAIVSWPPPARYPGLEIVYSLYFDPNPNTNCFPSQSTALYASVAAGIYSLHKVGGWVLWAMVAVCVALPRMYVGGHYLTDVLVGVLLALTGYAVARYLLEAKVISKIPPIFDRNPGLKYALDFLMFLWILQVAVEYREVSWVEMVVKSLMF